MTIIDPNSDHPRSRPSIRLLAAALVLAGLLAYSNSFEGVFVLDDLPHIVNNADLAHAGPMKAVVDSRPLVSLSLWLNHALDRAAGGTGLDPLGYHLFNMAVHLIAAVVLFDLVRRSLDGAHPQAVWLAFGSALLWVVHPLTTQAVTYIIQRGESMMAMFFLLSIYCVARGAERNRWGWYIAAVAAGWLSCASKQVAVVLPVVMLLYDRAFLAGTFAEAIRRRWGVYVGVAIGSAALAVSAMSASGDDATAGFGMQHIAWWSYALTQPGVILHYLRLTVWPAPLVFDYGWPVATQAWRIAVTGSAVAVLVAVTCVALRRWPRVGFVAASFFLVLAPTSSIMPINDLAVEHRMYLPLAAVIVLTVAGAAWVLRRAAGHRWPIVGAALLAGVVLTLGSLTFARNQDYHDPARLWRDTIASRPNNARAYHNLANVLFERGDTSGAIDLYRRALELEPRNAQAHVNLGVALRQAGQTAGAQRQFEQALAVWENYAPALNEMGILRVNAGEPAEAAAWFQRAVESDPTFADAYVHLGHVYYSLGQWERAAEAYEASVRLRPGDPLVHNNLGISFAQMGRLSEAAAQFAEAVRLDPAFDDAKANLRRAREMLLRSSP